MPADKYTEAFLFAGHYFDILVTRLLDGWRWMYLDDANRWVRSSDQQPLVSPDLAFAQAQRCIRLGGISR